MHAAKAREITAIVAGEKATLRAVKARQAVWNLVDEERRKRGMDGVAGGDDRWGENGAPRGYGELTDTHLGCTFAATDLCRRVHEIQERRKRVVSCKKINEFRFKFCSCCWRLSRPRAASWFLLPSEDSRCTCSHQTARHGPPCWRQSASQTAGR